MPDSTGDKALRKGLMWAALTGGLAVGCVASLPVLVAHIPWRMEQALGRALATQTLGTSCADGNTPGFEDLAALVTRLYPQSAADAKAPITVHVVDSADINAFAALGGEVYILQGLLEAAQSPDELAGVLAHELEHVAAHHLLQHLAGNVAISAIFSALLGDDSALSELAHNIDFWSNLKFSRDQEAAADAGAIRRLQAAGISLAGFADFFERMDSGPQVPAFLSDHPGHKDRAERVRAKAPYPATAAMPWSTWQRVKHLCQAAPDIAKAKP